MFRCWGAKLGRKPGPRPRQCRRLRFVVKVPFERWEKLQSGTGPAGPPLMSLAALSRTLTREKSGSHVWTAHATLGVLPWRGINRSCSQRAPAGVGEGSCGARGAVWPGSVISLPVSRCLRDWTPAFLSSIPLLFVQA